MFKDNLLSERRGEGEGGRERQGRGDKKQKKEKKKKKNTLIKVYMHAHKAGYYFCGKVSIRVNNANTFLWIVSAYVLFRGDTFVIVRFIA